MTIINMYFAAADTKRNGQQQHAHSQTADTKGPLETTLLRGYFGTFLCPATKF